jgi:hypothetical protein
VRRFLPLAAALALLLTPGLSILPAGAPGAAVAVAAATGLTTTADARYTVDPAGHVVHVVVSLSASNHLSDTRTHRYFFDRVYLAVPAGTTGFRISGAGTKPTVAVAGRKSTYTLLRIGFGAQLASGASRSFRLGFEMPDPGGAATRTTRIGQSLVRFSAWGLAGDGATGGSVTVVFPSGFNVDVQGGALRKSTDASGNVVFSSGRIADPTTFIATFDADRPSALHETQLQIPLGAAVLPVTLRSWPDDAAWAKRVGDVLRKGLPVLATDIGLPWSSAQPLVVEESADRGAGGFAGRYDPTTGTIELAWYADPLVVLHQAAHAWFDGSLLADRWANDGFAAFYAGRAAKAIGVKTPSGDPLTAALRPAVVPLNAWTPPADGTVPTDPAQVTSQNAEEAAALTLAGLVAQRAGMGGLRSVWQAIHDGRAAYQPVGTGVDVERTTDVPDWRGLLDLLGDRTGADYSDLWSAWVVRPTEASLLTDRAAARDRYDAMVTRAGTWRLPPVVREALRVWRYDELGDLLDAASTALDARDAVAASAAAVGLTVPSTMQTAFEGPRGFAAASAEANAELAAIDAYRKAVAARPGQAGGPFEAIGLWNAAPDDALADAATAFANGDLETSVRDSSFARQTWEAADSVGRNRVVAVTASLAAILLAAWLAFRWYRDRGVRRRALLTDG